MDISNCKGSTSLRLRERISANCFARDSSRWATTSSLAFFSASSRSTGHPAAWMFSVIFRATSSDSQIRLAGWHSSWRSVCHRKSRSSRSSLPGNSRVPRPTIWLYRLRTLVGRRTTTQSTLGQSQPSVSSMELHRTLYFPPSKSLRTSARSWLLPLTSAARNPWALSRRQNF